MTTPRRPESLRGQPSLEEQLNQLTPGDRERVLSHFQAAQAVVGAAGEIDPAEELPPTVVGNTRDGATRVTRRRKPTFPKANP